MRLSATCFAALLLLAPAPLSAQEQSASANMIDRDEQSVGTVTFNQTRPGFVHVIAELTGLEPGPHGFHVHETGQCDIGEGFKTAGGHLAGDKDHGVAAENGPHPGDFPNINVGQNGVLRIEFFTDRLGFEAEGAALMDDDGSAVIIHADADDYSSQPSGNAGDRIACGVIRQPG